ncbi:MAG: RNase adapter RapZ [Propionibacteriaceae bacterium]|nr:RNase adapter RapZ [Propionibacteriaceae bacterium]
MQVIVITGMSGAGRRTAAHTIEDLGWYVVDNLPAALLLDVAAYLSQRQIDRLAVVLDVRSRSDLEQLPALFDQLAHLADPPRILYLEASDPVIVRRQESIRRPVPLQGTGRLLEGIQAERWTMSTLRAAADIVIDTTDLTVRQLQAQVLAAFGEKADSALQITVLSFGFKHGLPLDADLVLDVRFLPNPHWVPQLRPQTGLDQAVSRYVLDRPAAARFLDQAQALFDTVAQGYLDQGKRLVELAIGCTGGKHRSVAMAEAVGARLNQAGWSAAVVHRDLDRE